MPGAPCWRTRPARSRTSADGPWNGSPKTTLRMRRPRRLRNWTSSTTWASPSLLPSWRSAIPIGSGPSTPTLGRHSAGRTMTAIGSRGTMAGMSSESANSLGSAGSHRARSIRRCTGSAPPPRRTQKGDVLPPPEGRRGEPPGHGLGGLQDHPSALLATLLHDQALSVDPDQDLLAHPERERRILPEVSGDIQDEATLRVLVEGSISGSGHGPTEHPNGQERPSQRDGPTERFIPSRVLQRRGAP